jgi:hypothetical protein
MFWKSNKNKVEPRGKPKFDYPIGTIRVWQCPDKKWRCQSYGLYIPRDEPVGLDYLPDERSDVLPGWCELSFPHGNKEGFESEADAIAAWDFYSQHKDQPGRIISVPPSKDHDARRDGG